MVGLLNKNAIDDFYFAFYDGAIGFYIITASPGMQKQIYNSFTSEKLAVYDYFGKDDKFLPKDIIHFIEANKEKELFFILNFQIPFSAQEDYLALNMCRDVLRAYHKKIFFFTSKEMEHNISIAAMDFFDYCFPRIDFEDEKKEEIEQQIKHIDEDYDNIHHQAEIKYRLNLYKDKIEEYLNIKDIKMLTPIDKKAENYLLVAARDLYYFGGLYEKINNFDKALELHYKALDIRKKILGEEHSYTAASYHEIGYVYDSQGDYSQALDFYQKALDIDEKVLGNEHPNVALLYNNIGYIYYLLGNSQALEYHQKALKIWEKIRGNEHPDVAMSYNNIGLVYDSQCDYSQALEFYQKALMIWEKVYGNEHPNVATLYNNIGFVYDSQGAYSKALEYFQKALKIREKVLGATHPDTVETYNIIKEIKTLIN